MNGVNKAIVLGTCGKDAEIRVTAEGTTFASVSVATSEKYKDRQGNLVETTEWHSISFAGRLAEIAGEYLKKGSKVYIEGKIQTRKWQGQDGKDQYKTEIKALNMQLLDGKKQDSTPAKVGSQRPAPEPEPLPMDDDIPF
jgi:single-strand DNA-binding protein